MPHNIISLFCKKQQNPAGCAVFPRGNVFILSFFFVSVFGLFCTDYSISLAEEEPQNVLTIFCTANIRGNIFSKGKSKYDLRNLAAQMEATIYETVQREKEVLLLDAGNLLYGSTESNFDEGNTIISFIKTLKYDFLAPGRSDFEFGITEYLQKMSDLKDRILTENVLDKEGNPLFSGWKFIQKNGYHIAVIGCQSVFMDQWLSPKQMRGYTVHSVIASVEKIIPEIMEKQPDVIILLVQEGLFTPEYLAKTIPRYKNNESLKQIARRFPQISLIIGGYSMDAEPGRRMYPSCWFVQPPANGQGFAQIQITKKGKSPIQIESKIVYLNDIKDIQTKKCNYNLYQKIVSLRHAFAENANNVCMVFPQKKTMDSLYSDVMKFAVPDAVVALYPISTRKFCPQTFTLRNLLQYFPYENYLCSIEITRDEFRKLINEQEKLSETFALTGDGQNLCDVPFLQNKGNKMKCVMSSYAAAGGGGHYPFLRKLCQQKSAQFAEYPNTIREYAHTYLSTLRNKRE